LPIPFHFLVACFFWWGVRAGLARAKAQGKRLDRQPYAITAAQLEAVDDLSLREAGTTPGVSRSVVHRWRLSCRPLHFGGCEASKSSGISSVAAWFRMSHRHLVVGHVPARDGGSGGVERVARS
jgi:hypothetical protein